LGGKDTVVKTGVPRCVHRKEEPQCGKKRVLIPRFGGPNLEPGKRPKENPMVGLGGNSRRKRVLFAQWNRSFWPGTPFGNPIVVEKRLKALAFAETQTHWENETDWLGTKKGVPGEPPQTPGGKNPGRNPRALKPHPKKWGGPSPKTPEKDQPALKENPEKGKRLRKFESWKNWEIGPKGGGKKLWLCENGKME